MLASWTKHDTATTGTGTITLGSTVAGHTTVGDHFADGELVWYAIEDGNNREAGIGLFTVSGTTLARTFVKETLVSGTYDRTSPTAISLSGSATVSISALPQTWGWPGLVSTANEGYIRPLAVTGELPGGALAVTADRLYLSPVKIDFPTTYDAIRLNINIGAVGNFRVGVASMLDDLTAPSFLAESASTDSNVTGNQEISFTAIHLNVGYYYLVFLCDAAPTLTSYDRRHMGHATMMGTNNGNRRTQAAAISDGHTGAPVFPSSSGAITITPSVPFMLLARQ